MSKVNCERVTIFKLPNDYQMSAVARATIAEIVGPLGQREELEKRLGPWSVSEEDLALADIYTTLVKKRGSDQIDSKTFSCNLDLMVEEASANSRALAEQFRLAAYVAEPLQKNKYSLAQEAFQSLRNSLEINDEDITGVVANKKLSPLIKAAAIELMIRLHPKSLNKHPDKLIPLAIRSQLPDGIFKFQSLASSIGSSAFRDYVASTTTGDQAEREILLNRAHHRFITAGELAQEIEMPTSHKYYESAALALCSLGKWDEASNAAENAFALAKKNLPAGLELFYSEESYLVTSGGVLLHSETVSEAQLVGLLSGVDALLPNLVGETAFLAELLVLRLMILKRLERHDQLPKAASEAAAMVQELAKQEEAAIPSIHPAVLQEALTLHGSHN